MKSHLTDFMGDRFTDSLSLRVYSEPPSIDTLAGLFQEFYVKAGLHISTHISTLSSRLNREASPARTPSTTKLKPLLTKASTDSVEPSGKPLDGQQMLTASEVADRRKARKLLEYKRIVLEEAVEQRACEKVYDKIWRHKSTLDEVRDEKLRSKTAALGLVGIGLKDLGIEVGQGKITTEDHIRKALAPARKELAMMNEERFPLGKLQHLTSAHKSIVDILSTIHPSSSSADEILPTLIYALITSPDEGINVISNLCFIQRFRATTKVDGEAAYCITNLEAAVSFLENVDLASLREDEAPEGPLKSVSRPSTPTVEKSDPISNLMSTVPTKSDPALITMTSSAVSASTLHAPSFSRSRSSSPTPSPTQERRLSNLLQPSAKAIGAANDAVRNTAEEGFRNISNTLDNSFKILFGRLHERGDQDPYSEVIVPKTLDEARRLVDRPLTPADDAGMSETSSIAERDDLPGQHFKAEDKLLGLIGGRKAASIRERSVDSVRSNSSGKKVFFAALANAHSPAAPAHPPLAQPNALDSVKNLGNSLNPLSHIGSAFGSGFRSFSKAVSSPPLAPVAKEKTKVIETPLIITDSAAGAVQKIKPPLQRFLDMQDPSDLTLKEVADLLHDYQRLGGILKDLAKS